MKKQLLGLLIVIMAVVMAVFIGIQVYWIRNSMQLREANFRRSIDEAVNRALLNLETIEFSRLSTNASLQILSRDTNSLLFNSMGIQNVSNPDSQVIAMAKQSNQEGRISNDRGKTEAQPNDSDKNENEPVDLNNSSSEGAAVRKQWMLNYLMNKTSSEEGIKDIEKKISVGLMDTLLKLEFANKGIKTDYEFGVYSPDRNKIVLEKTGKYHDELLSKGIMYPLFSGGAIATRDFLLIYFPSQSRYNLMSLWIMMLVSILLVFVIMF